MPDCINLLTAFGDRYRIDYDPAYKPSRTKDARDPWYMVIPCQRGAIYPQGGTRLVVEVDGRPITINRLKSLDCVTLKQRGDHFVAFTFDVTDFDEIAAIVMPRRRRVMSEANRIAARNRFLARRRPTPEQGRGSDSFAEDTVGPTASLVESGDLP